MFSSLSLGAVISKVSWSVYHCHGRCQHSVNFGRRSCSFTVVYHALLCSGSVLDCRVHHLLHGQVPDPFLILENPGEGDEFMNSEFHHTLEGRSMADTFTDVAAIGSTVTIRLINTQGGYLHWHPHN